ncbi:hypothetical protein [Bradyrhizobium sp. USDA 3256]
MAQDEADRAPEAARRFTQGFSFAGVHKDHTKVQLSRQFHGLYCRLFAIAD